MLLWPTFSSTTRFALGAVAAMTRLETRFGSWLPVPISTGMVSLSITAARSNFPFAWAARTAASSSLCSKKSLRRPWWFFDPEFASLLSGDF